MKILNVVTIFLSLGFVGCMTFPENSSDNIAENIVDTKISSICPLNNDSDSSNLKKYDVIVFGDEVPGVMSAIKVKRELERRIPSAKVALITEGDTTRGIGGHLVRGGLGYLDRNQVPRDMRSKLGRFGASSQLYQEFLDITGTKTIALDRFKANEAFKRILAQEKIDVIGNVKLKSVATNSNIVCSFTTEENGTFAAKQFIDATQGGKLAEMGGADILPGFAALGLPDSSLSLGWIFETYGLKIDELKQLEEKLIRRFQNSKDEEAQEHLNFASGGDKNIAQQILGTMVTPKGAPRTLYQGTSDSADVRSLAVTTGFHGYTESKILNDKAVLDRANIAVLKDRLSLNALLFFASAQKSRELSNTGAKPEPEMFDVGIEVQEFFQELGAKRVELMSELYIRSAGQIANPVEELSSTLMTAGGVPADEALGTFSYHLDIRGGIKGLGERAASAGISNISFHHMPTFNYGFRHTLPEERKNLAVLSPASGFGGLGQAAGRIVEFNVSVGEGLAIAVAKAIAEQRSLQTISHQEVRKSLGYKPEIYGRPTKSLETVFLLEATLREF